MITPDLVEAARFERDWRAERYPARIAAGESDAEAASVDYQCWCAIARWLETDRFESLTGGAEPDSPNAPIVSWAACELAAESALISVAAKCDRLFHSATVGVDGRTNGDAVVKAGEYEQTCVRRAALWAIHRKVQLRRQTIDAINAEFRAHRAATVAA